MNRTEQVANWYVYNKTVILSFTSPLWTVKSIRKDENVSGPAWTATLFVLGVFLFKPLHFFLERVLPLLEVLLIPPHLRQLLVPSLQLGPAMKKRGKKTRTEASAERTVFVQQQQIAEGRLCEDLRRELCFHINPNRRSQSQEHHECKRSATN